MKTQSRFIRTFIASSPLARAALLAPALYGVPGCASEGVDLGGGTVAQELRRGSRCRGSAILEQDVIVAGQADVAALEGCQEIRGNLTIQLFPAADLSALRALTAVDGTLSIGQEAALVAFSDPDFDPELVEALGEQDAELIAGGWLQSLSGLEALERVGALLVHATSVRDLSALQRLRAIGGTARADGLGGLESGSVSLVGNRQLVDLTGLENVRGIDTLAVLDSPSLVSLSGVSLEPALTAVLLNNAPSLVDLGALAPVSRVTTLGLAGLGISDLSALSGLQRADSIGLAGNPALADASGLENLMASSVVSFTDNDALRSLPSFSRWLRVPDQIEIQGNDALESVELEFGGVADVRTVGDEDRPLPASVVNIENNARLLRVSVPAVESNSIAGLTSVELFLLQGNPGLSSVDFGGLRRVGLLSIANNESLASVALGDLARVEDLEVSNNPLLPGSAFDGVATFERTSSGNLP